MSVTTPPTWQRYGLPVLLCALATVLTLGMGPYIDQTPAVLFFAAVLLSAWFGGLGPGVCASFLSLALLHYFILSPTISQSILVAHEIVGLAMFLLVTLLVTTLTVARQQSELAVHLEREWLRVTLGSIGEAVIATDLQGRVRFMNGVAETLTGWRQAESTQRPIEDVFHIVNEQTRAIIENPVTRVLRDSAGAGRTNHTLLMARQGRAIPIDESAAPIRNDRGGLIGVVLVFRDVSERQQAEQALRQSEDRFRSVVNTAPLMVWMAAPDGAITFANDQWFHYCGLTLAQNARDWPELVLHPDDRERCIAAWTHALQTGTEYEIEARNRRHDGEYRWFITRAVPARDAEGRVTRWFGTSIDIHTRKQVEELLRESETRFRMMADTAPVMVWMSGPATTCTFFNRLWLEFRGRTLEQELGSGWVEGVHPDDYQRCQDAYQKAFDAQEPFEMEYRLRRADGEYRWVVDRGTPRFESGQGFVGYIGSSLDIHERKQAELGQRLLAEAGQVLASSLNYEARLADVTRLVVPELADWSAVDVLDENEEIRRVSVFHRDPAKVAKAHDLRRRYPVKLQATNGVARVLRTGQAEFYPVITDAMRVATLQDPEQLQLARDLGSSSAMLVPLTARGRTLGVHILVMAESGRHYTESDLELAKELGRRTALALDNARLYTEMQALNVQLENRILERTQQLEVTVSDLRREIGERQQAEEKIRQSERRLKEAQQIARLGSWYWDILANTITWSEELYQIYGQSPETIQASYEGFLELVHPDDRAHVQTVIDQAYQDQDPFAFDHRLIRPDGTVRTLHARGAVHVNAEGQAAAMEGIAQDITERKRADEALRRSREQLRRLSAGLQAVREEERTRMSREIHDQLGGAMTGLKMDVAALRKGLYPEQDVLLARANAMSQLLDGTIQSIRRIATELRPAILDDFGLLAAVEWQLQEFQARAGIACQLNTTLAQVPLDPESSTAIFRVFQETLTNVARHANATQVVVSLEQQAQTLILRVQDNGRGISEEEISGTKSLGLVGMQERILMLSGELDIRGVPGQGTTVLIRIPLTKASQLSPHTYLAEARPDIGARPEASA